jgi:hypothetical protein
MGEAFLHEGLDCYKLAVQVSRWAAMQAGRGPGDSRRKHYRIALGSAAEVAAIIDVSDFPDGDERRGEARRIGAMPYGPVQSMSSLRDNMRLNRLSPTLAGACPRLAA